MHAVMYKSEVVVNNIYCVYICIICNTRKCGTQHCQVVLVFLCKIVIFDIYTPTIYLYVCVIFSLCCFVWMQTAAHGCNSGGFNRINFLTIEDKQRVSGDVTDALWEMESQTSSEKRNNQMVTTISACVCVCECVWTHPPYLHQVGYHDDGGGVLLPNHPPEIVHGLLHGT